MTVGDAMHAASSRAPRPPAWVKSRRPWPSTASCVVAIDEGPPGRMTTASGASCRPGPHAGASPSPMDLDAGNLAELDVATAAPEDSLEDAARTMARRGVAHLWSWRRAGRSA